MRKIAVTVDGQTYEVELAFFPQSRSNFSVRVDGQDHQVIIPNLNGLLEGLEWVLVDDRPYQLIFDRDLHWLQDFSGTHAVKIRDLETKADRSIKGSGQVKAPIPGQVAEILVTPGQNVERGQILLVLEAMKMQNQIRSQVSGRVESVKVLPGENVSRGQTLVEIA